MCSPRSSTLAIWKRFITIAGKYLRSIRGPCGLRPRLRGESMKARKGYDATAMRSRGTVGKRMAGALAAAANRAAGASAEQSRKSRRFMRRGRSHARDDVDPHQGIAGNAARG